MTNAIDLSDRDIRQRDILPPERLSKIQATIIGVGSVGRQVALQLASIGVPWIRLVDHDTVGVENLACQGFFPGEIGENKVDAVAHMCRRINHEITLTADSCRFKTDDGVTNYTFCCVDSIDIRSLIWDAVKNKTDFFVDGRMSAEVIRVLTAHDVDSKDAYAGTLFAGSEAQGGSCTSKSTIFTANICAGLMLSSLSKHLRDMPVDSDVTLNLLSNELTAGNPEAVPA